MQFVTQLTAIALVPGCFYLDDNNSNQWRCQASLLLIPLTGQHCRQIQLGKSTICYCSCRFGQDIRSFPRIEDSARHYCMAEMVPLWEHEYNGHCGNCCNFDSLRSMQPS